MAEMLSGIEKILVYPGYLEICFNSWALLGIEEMPKDFNISKEADKLAVITIPQNCSTSHYPMMEEEKERILDLMYENPRITARKIAGEMGVNLSLVLRRIRALKEEGRIYYSVPNGRGEWIVVDRDMT